MIHLLWILSNISVPDTKACNETDFYAVRMPSKLFLASVNSKAIGQIGDQEEKDKEEVS